MNEPHVLRLGADPACPGRARAWLEQLFAGRVAPDRLDDMRLVVSELVTNAFVHGRGAIELRVAHDEARARIEVVDEGEDAAIRIREHGTEIGGWGLQLVEDLSSGWGAFEGTTHVWAELPLR